MKKQQCLAPDCELEPVARGLCGRHYMQARRAVQRGLTTWDKLVRAGKAKAANYQRSDWLHAK